MNKRILSILVLFFVLNGVWQCTESIFNLNCFNKVVYANDLIASLKDIYISGDADIDFNKDVFNYSIDVSKDEQDILIKPKPTFNNDKVFVNGVETERDNKYRAMVDLKYGKNAINIDVKDCINGKITSYVLYVYRGGSDSIRLRDINIDERKIGFEEGKRSYDIELDENDRMVRLSVVPEEGNYSVKVNDKLLGKGFSIKLKFNEVAEYTVNVTLIDNDTQKQSNYILHFFVGIEITDDVENSVKEALKANRWVVKNGRWRYNDSKGKCLRDVWFFDPTYMRYFYLNSKGYMQTGWYTHDDGNTYYLNNHGAMQTGWLQYQNNWYYLDEHGVMRTGWIKDKGKWYYLDNKGAMQTGWIKDRDKWYFLDLDGSMMTGWIIYDKNYYHLDNDGSMHTGWLKYNKEWYYMDNVTGYMKMGEWVFSEGNWYYLMNSGKMIYDNINNSKKRGWLYFENNDKFYYFNKDGTMRTSPITISNYTYNFNKDGSVIFFDH